MWRIAWFPMLLSSATAVADDRVPIAVMDLAGRGVDEAAAGALTTEVSNTLNTLRVFRVITREDIKRMLQLEQAKQQCTGGADAACMAEIGGALGVDYLIYGEVAKIAETYSLSLVLLDIANAQAKNRANKKIADTRQLLDEAEAATKILVQPLLADKKGFLILDVQEANAKVTLDARLVGITPLSGRLELAMGGHEVVVEKEGFLAWARTVDVSPGQATVEPVALVPSQEFIEDYESTASVTRVAAWITAGSAAVLLGTGAVLRLTGNARFDGLVNKRYLTQQASVCAESNPSYNGSDYCPTALGYENNVLEDVDSIERTDSIGLIASVTGAACGLVSVYLFLTGDDPGKYSAFGEGTNTQVMPLSIGPNGASLSLPF